MYEAEKISGKKGWGYITFEMLWDTSKIDVIITVKSIKELISKLRSWKRMKDKYSISMVLLKEIVR